MPLSIKCIKCLKILSKFNNRPNRANNNNCLPYFMKMWYIILLAQD